MSNGAMPIKHWLTNSAINWLFASLGVLITAFLVFSPFSNQFMSLKLGERASYTVLAPHSITLETSSDTLRTSLMVEKVLAQTQPVYKQDTVVNQSIVASLDSFFEDVSKYRTQTHGHAFDLNEVPASLRFLDNELLQAIRFFSTESLRIIEYSARQSTQWFLSNGVLEIDPEIISTQVRAMLSHLQLSASERDLISQLIIHVLSPNLVIDTEKTELAKNKAIAKLPRFKTTILQDRPIVFEGDIVSQDHLDILTLLRAASREADLKRLGGIILIVSFSFAFFERFLFFFSPKIHASPKYFWLVFLIMILVLGIARVLLVFDHMPFGIYSAFLVPIPISAILLSLLVTANIALLVGTVLALLISLMYDGGLSLFFYLFVMSAVTTFSIFKRYKRRDIVVSGYIVGVFSIISVVIFGLLDAQSKLTWYIPNSMTVFVSGVLSSMIVLAVLPYFESGFKITTSQSLLELSNLDHPLLKRLMLRVPGTYQHSLMVGNLAEAAAEAIQANPLLARVGGYYHDIGKIKRPQFFIENQHSGDNPHNSLSPRMSKIIIASHTQEGAELADKYALPDIIKRFILTHHGTSLVSFFYQQAVQSEGLEECEESKDEFRYPGPKPISREEGIVMLADTVEASLRSMGKLTPEQMASVIDNLFREKVDDGQLAECLLTFKDLQDIRNTFLRVFQSVYHSRMDYQLTDTKGRSDD